MGFFSGPKKGDWEENNKAGEKGGIKKKIFFLVFILDARGIFLKNYIIYRKKLFGVLRKKKKINSRKNPLAGFISFVKNKNISLRVALGQKKINISIKPF